MKSINRVALFVFLASIVSCLPSNKLNTDLKHTVLQIQPKPLNYISPYELLNQYYEQAIRYKTMLEKKGVDFKSPEWKLYTGYMQAYETTYYELLEINKKLRNDGQIKLERGKSYAFYLESFCANPGPHRPVDGDGFRPGPVKGGALKWLPQLLKSYKNEGLTQDEAQTIIWSVESGAKFDEYDSNVQQNLLKIFPDAPVRFGNQKIESKAKNLLKRLLTDEVPEINDQFMDLKSVVTSSESTYAEIEQIAAPVLNRDPITIGWVKMPSGYFIQTTSSDSYMGVKKEIYVPEDLPEDPVFDPTKQIDIPGQGQRIASSPNPRDPEMKDVSWTCDQVKKRAPKNCSEMTSEYRSKILKAADPSNFPRARYALPPNRENPIEVETDCSTFTYEIYAREGFEYPMSTTHAMECIQTFKKVTKEQALPGDLVLYDGHVGIYDYNDTVISATQGGDEKKSTLDPDDENFMPSITRYGYKTFNNPR
ncbi:MAG: C40 family peptidase, partial [Bdellovibrionales bacterium]|nr:C40 family peptidase [Bdellovibrionales bacterium]